MTPIRGPRRGKGFTIDRMIDLHGSRRRRYPPGLFGRSRGQIRSGSIRPWTSPVSMTPGKTSAFSCSRAGLSGPGEIAFPEPFSGGEPVCGGCRFQSSPWCGTTYKRLDDQGVLGAGAKHRIGLGSGARSQALAQAGFFWRGSRVESNVGEWNTHEPVGDRCDRSRCAPMWGHN
jgi:hypothetical protein